MLRRILFMLGIVALTGGYMYAQNATIKGKVTELDGKTPIEFATVRLMQEGQLVLGIVTDEKGNYTLSPVASGKYDLMVTFIGFQDYILQGLEISGNLTKIVDVPLNSGDQILEAVVITAERPIFEPGQVEGVQRVSSDDIELMAGKSLGDILSTMSGVTSSSAGTSFRGDRPGEESYIVDGMATTMLPPRASWSGIALIQGAIPAEYAEAAVIEIETKGYSPLHHGSVEVIGSVDGFNDFSLNFYLTGPFVKRKKDGSVLMGYVLSGAGGYGSGDDVRGGTYRASEETIDYLINNPHRDVVGGTLSSQVTSNLNYVTKYQEGEILSLEEKKRRRVQNAWSASGTLNGKLDIRASDNFDIMLKGSVSYNKGKSWNLGNSLFNSINNGMSEGLHWDVNARITHRIKTDPKSIVKNVYYRLYGYYYQGQSKSYSHLHKDNLFDYGYIGKFAHERANYYALGTVDFEGQTRTAYILQTPYTAGVTFDGSSSKNPDLAKYTLSALDRAGSFASDNTIGEYGGLLNGDFLKDVLPSAPAYGFFSAPGVPYNGYGQSFNDRVAAKASFSFDIGNHSIKFGFDFEQTTQRSHSIAPTALWKIMRDKTNAHITLDPTQPIPVTENGRFLDTMNYQMIASESAQSKFDRNLRIALNKDPNGTEWIDIDQIDPSWYEEHGGLDLFGPEDLFNSGNGILGFYGYNYTGKKRINTPITMNNMEKWFNGGNTYPDFSEIGAYKPLRISAYIQDKFAIKSLFFDLGLRLDVFDKNQPYIKDMFLYREAYTVGEVNFQSNPEDIVPDFILKDKNDYYIYVADIDAEITKENITAYRNGKTWYDPSGNEVTDPNTLATAAGSPELLPFLKEKPGGADITKVHHSAFDNYTPTFENGGIALSPRIAFAFTVAENSKFTASYNIITKSMYQRLDPVTYLFFSTYSTNSGNSPLANPGLKPEKNINYEVGFEQAINKNLKVSFSAYYSEKRDQLQVYHYSQAYPTSYYSYTNMDFGTTQGFILGMEMRRTKNLSFTASYTLQFAKGTGSSASSSLTLIRNGLPNLRTLTVLTFDQRHKFNLNLIYQFHDGPNYNGPITRKEIKNTGRIREIKWFQLAGVSLTFSAGSGLPYTASSEPYSTLVNQGERLVKGSIYGSRMPWDFNCDLNIWKGFPLVLKKSDDPRGRKMGSLVVALAIKHLLELDRITSVYSYTGSPTDDGFLTASKFQQYIAAQENLASFTDYYTITMEGVNRLGVPRLFNLSIRFEF
jgi:outer membrane receptor for ferrienterochelin and colicin